RSAERANAGVEELIERTKPAALVDRAGVEDQRREVGPAVGGRRFGGHVGSDRSQDLVRRGSEPPAVRLSEGDGARDHRLARLVALEHRRGWQAEPLRDRAAQRRVGERLVAVPAHASRSRIAATPWPPAAQIEINPRPEPFSASSFASGATVRPPVAPNGWPAASEEPFTFSLSRSIEPSG